MALEYRSFEAEALKSSPLLKSAEIEKRKALLEGDLALRYENPSIEGELSSFDPDGAAKESGWRLGLSQEFRTLSLGNDLKKYADALSRAAKNSFEKRRSTVIAILRSKYTDYVREVKREALIKEEIELAERLESIARERFKSGAGTRAKLMQASLQKIAAKTRLSRQIEKRVKSYYSLLEAAALEKMDLEAAFLYRVERATASSDPENFELQALRAKKELLEAKAKTEKRVIKGFRLFTEYEKEPDQSAARIGIETAIPLFNQNMEEARITELRAKQSAIEAELLKKRQALEIDALYKQISALADRLDMLKMQLKKAKELLSLFEEGYRSSQSSLLDLIDTKNSLIETKLEILNTKYLANIYTIRLNYLKGELK